MGIGGPRSSRSKIEMAKDLVCAFCGEMNELLFTERVNRVGHLKCDEKITFYHSIPSWFQCQYCEHFNKIYCCNASHREIGECSVCGKVKEISFSRPSHSTDRTIH